MATRLWNGASATFDTAADWSPAGVPAAGDRAVIASGTVVAVNMAFLNLPIQVGAGGGNGSLQLYSTVIGAGSVVSLDLGGTGSLLLANSTIAAGATVKDDAVSTTVTIAGLTANQGVLSFAAAPTLHQTLLIADGARLTNTGTIAVNSSLSLTGGGASAALVNNGTISFTDIGNGAGGQTVISTVPITGTGTILLNDQARVDQRSAVGAGQTIVFAPGARNVILQDDAVSSLSAGITGFAATDLIALTGLSATTLSYVNLSATTGVLLLLDGSGAPVAGLHMNGVYTTASFTKVFNDFGGGLTNTQITTTATIPQVAVTDVTTGVSDKPYLSLYSGPVSYLQWQYIFTSPDAVAMSASVPNVFLKSGAGQDALQVSGGQNVLDGGGGSNFLIGGTGPGSADTFFVDGRGSAVTWSTIVNFHAGDMATIFGFTGGVSTQPITAMDGTSGYQGVTIHSELQGAGTGVNASITFTGIDQATLQNHFTLTTGTVGTGADATSYLAILYDH